MTEREEGPAFRGRAFGAYQVGELIKRVEGWEFRRAQDTRLEVEVTLALSTSERTLDGDFIRRLEREVRVLARLQGHHVVLIYDVGVIEGRLYAVTMRSDDADLETILERRGALPPTQAVDLVAQIAEALDRANAEGLVYGDLKPSNVFFTQSEGTGTAYLTIPGAIRGADEEVPAARGGAPVETVAYMAPEQLSSGDPGDDRRVDVFALGALFYAALTGEPPFPQGDEGAATSALSDRAHRPRPSARIASLSSFDAVVTGALAVDPDERPKSAGELARQARSALTHATRVEGLGAAVTGPDAVAAASDTFAGSLTRVRRASSMLLLSVTVALLAVTAATPFLGLSSANASATTALIWFVGSLAVIAMVPLRPRSTARAHAGPSQYGLSKVHAVSAERRRRQFMEGAATVLDLSGRSPSTRDPLRWYWSSVTDHLRAVASTDEGRP